MFKREKKGQSTLEYALIITIIISGLLFMQKYVRRGYVGRLKSSADNIGDQLAAGAVSSSWTTHRQGETTDVTGFDVAIDSAGITTFTEAALTANARKESATVITGNDKTERWGSETVTAVTAATDYGK